MMSGGFYVPARFFVPAPSPRTVHIRIASPTELHLDEQGEASVHSCPLCLSAAAPLRPLDDARADPLQKPAVMADRQDADAALLRLMQDPLPHLSL